MWFRWTSLTLLPSFTVRMSLRRRYDKDARGEEEFRMFQGAKLDVLPTPQTPASKQRAIHGSGNPTGIERERLEDRDKTAHPYLLNDQSRKI